MLTSFFPCFKRHPQNTFFAATTKHFTTFPESKCPQNILFFSKENSAPVFVEGGVLLAQWPVQAWVKPINFTNFITLPAPLLHCIDGIMIFVQKVAFYKIKSTKKLSQLELLFWLKYAPDSLSAGTPLQTPLGKLTVLPNTGEEGKAKERKRRGGREETGEKGSSARPLFRCFRRL